MKSTTLSSKSGARISACGLRVLGVELEDLLFLSRELARALRDGALHFVVGDGDAVLLADARQHEAEAHAALGDVVIFLLELVLGLALVGGRLAFALQFGLDRVPDAVEFAFDHRRRQREGMRLVERVENAALQVQAAGAARNRSSADRARDP